MDGKYVVYDDVLDRESLVALQKYFVEQQNQLKWFYTDNLIVPKGNDTQQHSVNPSTIVTKTGGGFVLPIPNEYEPLDEHIFSIIKRIKRIVENKTNTSFELLRAKVNLTKPQTFSEQNKIDAIHIDRDKEHVSFIFYVNTNDGCTLLYDADRKNVIKKIRCVENRVVMFDGLIPHAGIPSTNADKCIINFNVREKNNKTINNNNMSNQEQQQSVSPYARMSENKIEYKTLFSQHVGQLDDEVTEYLNDGWMPHGPQYSVGSNFYQAVIKVPQQMMSRAL